MIDGQRNKLTAKMTLVSNGLCLFNVAFFRLFRSKRSATDAKLLLDGLYGRPTPAMIESLQRDVKRIRAISEKTLYNTFFEDVGLPVPSTKELAQKLEWAVQNSRRRGYHGENARFMRRRARLERSSERNVK